jgi:hypothetical protein
MEERFTLSFGFSVLRAILQIKLFILLFVILQLKLLFVLGRFANEAS